MINLVLLSRTPIAGAAWQQYRCFQKYASDILSVRYICQRDRYADGRVFPHDLLFTDRESKDVIKQADVLHFHNDLLNEALPYINKKRQKVCATLHSVPRQGQWRALTAFAHKNFCIRQPAQIREWGLPSLPNMFDIWEFTPLLDRKDLLKIVYCPTNLMDTTHIASKGYKDVMQVLSMIPQEHIIHFRGKPYLENLEIKRQGHIMIDDIVKGHNTFHLTSIEGAAFSLVGLTDITDVFAPSVPYPFIPTHIAQLKERIDFLFANPSFVQEKGVEARQWVETHWNPRDQVHEYIDHYT